MNDAEAYHMLYGALIECVPFYKERYQKTEE
jgi:hypothetical protein